jgi:hypothetical protein
MNAQEYKAPDSVNRVQTGGLVVGGIALLLAIFGAITSPEKFVHSYIFGYMLVVGMTLGSLGILMLQHLTGGQWGIFIRRPLEAATRNLWLIFLLFIPVLLGMKFLYSGNTVDLGWLNSPKTGEHALSHLQQWYLTTSGFVVRAIIYFAIWALLVYLFNKWSREEDSQDGGEPRRRMKAVAAPGIILYVLAMSFAAFDWMMSISPHWASTIYGFLIVAGQLIVSMALMVVVVSYLSGTTPLHGIITKRHLHDLAKLLFAFNMLWAYFDFSQLLIIWSGNQPEEITFYRTRLYGGWGVVAVLVLIFSFAIPFLLLLSKDIKRNASLVSKVAIWMILMRLLDLYWMTRPEFTRSALPDWRDLVVPVALVGLWLGFFAMNLKQRPLLPLGDPNLAEAIGQHEH